MSDRSRTTSSFIIESLRESGIEHFFGIPGVHVLALFDALHDLGGSYIGSRQEHAAAHAADGYGRVTGIPGALLLSTGPGTLNALSGLAEAMVSSSPVIAITSTIPSKLVGRQKGYLHETKDLADAFSSVTRFAGRAAKALEVPELLQQALEASFGGRPGPSLIEIPMDVLEDPLDADPIRVERTLVEPDENQLSEAANLLRLSARPVLWAGGGVVRSGASAELVRLAEVVGSPVITSFMGKGAFPEDHPLAVGAMVRQPEAAELLRDADLLLSVGARFSGMSTDNWRLDLPAQHIQIDIDPEELGRNYPLRLGIHADAGLALTRLTPLIEGKVVDELWSARSREVRDASFSRARESGPREMKYLEALRDALPHDTPTFQDMTIPSYWSAPFFPVTQPRTFHYPYGYGSLGFSFPAALGAAAALRRPVVSINGDGGFQYHAGELASAAQYALPVKAIVFNDRSWGILKVFSDSRYGTARGMDLPGPDFAKLAGAYGIPAMVATEPDQLHKAVTEALAIPGPVLIEVPGQWGPPPPSGYYGRK